MNTGPQSDCTSPVLEHLERLHQEYAGLGEGEIAQHLPELAAAKPDWFGICLVTANGSVYEVGDSSRPFAIQAIAKPFVYGLALEDNGRMGVLEKVGVEPTGDKFDSISMDFRNGRPRNPIINAGAIAMAGLIAGSTPEARLKRCLETFGLYAGRELVLDNAVYRSESSMGHRNRGIGHMLRGFNILTEEPTPVIELYLQQRSISVTCRDLGVMAATLANRGVNPLTGKQAIRGEYVESILSVMGSCGMYDYSGEWMYEIGMPAKSGVSGGIIAVLSGHLGIGIFSPLLDSQGNSVRGIRVCRDLSRHLDLHLCNQPTVGKSTIRLKFNAAQRGSSRVRTPEESQVLRERGHTIEVYQLQGHLDFTSAEVVLCELIKRVDSMEYVILDLKRVLSLAEIACRLFYQLLEKLSGLGKWIVFTHVDHLPLLRRYMKVKLGRRFEELFRTLEDHDPALEWCENRLLDRSLPRRITDRSMDPAQYELFENFTPKELKEITALLKRRTYERGETILHIGEDAREMFFIARGDVSVLLPLAEGTHKRLATFSAGMTFGEMAMMDGAPRSANIVADSAVECHILAIEDFRKLGDSHPGARIKLLENLCLTLCRNLREANRELGVFD